MKIGACRIRILQIISDPTRSGSTTLRPMTETVLELGPDCPCAQISSGWSSLKLVHHPRQVSTGTGTYTGTNKWTYLQYRYSRYLRVLYHIQYQILTIVSSAIRIILSPPVSLSSAFNVDFISWIRPSAASRSGSRSLKLKSSYKIGTDT